MVVLAGDGAGCLLPGLGVVVSSFLAVVLASDGVGCLLPGLGVVVSFFIIISSSPVWFVKKN